MNKLRYCPVCGRNTFNRENCPMCNTIIHTVESKYDRGYYINKSKEQYSIPDNYWEVLHETEIATNPLFNQAEYERVKDMPWKRKDDSYPKETSSNPNVPRCPTCQSTNIKKISVAKRATHGFAFGIFSKTAFSQFQCNNCGYKW